MNIFSRILSNQSGATAIEYGLLAALIALSIIGTLMTIGDQVLVYFEQASSAFTS